MVTRLYAARKGHIPGLPILHKEIERYTFMYIKALKGSPFALYTDALLDSLLCRCYCKAI